MNRRIIFESSAFEDYNEWGRLNKKMHRKIIALIKDINPSYKRLAQQINLPELDTHSMLIAPPRPVLNSTD